MISRVSSVSSKTNQSDIDKHIQSVQNDYNGMEFFGSQIVFTYLRSGKQKDSKISILRIGLFVWKNFLGY